MNNSYALTPVNILGFSVIDKKWKTWNPCLQVLHCYKIKFARNPCVEWPFKPECFHPTNATIPSITTMLLSAPTLHHEIWFLRSPLPTFTFQSHILEIPCIHKMKCILFMITHSVYKRGIIYISTFYLKKILPDCFYS